MEEIDLVITWVDGNDPYWLEERSKYDKNVGSGAAMNRFREWDNLQYWFRGVEKYLPWIRKIHFITWGHIPSWLDTTHPKLHIVKHEDFIPKEYLPTFNSNAIELNMHRIEGLSEHFIYSNDDTFFIKSASPTDFFKNGVPCDCAIESVHQFRLGGIDHIVGNNLAILNDHFQKRKTIKENFKKWFSLKYKKSLLKNIYMAPFGNFTGFINPHLQNPYCKSTFQELWKYYFDAADITCRNRFRADSDINHWLIRYWQFASGNFVPGNMQIGMFYSIKKDDMLIKKAIMEQRYKTICLSDDDITLDFEEEKQFLIQQFNGILPEKSKYEK